MERSTRLLCLVTLLFSLALPSVASSAASKAYTPSSSSCNAASLIRSAGSGSQRLSSQEVSYISGRKSSVLPSAWSTYLANVKTHASAHGVSVPDYVGQLLGSGQVPDGLTLGFAVSGGGYRAAVVGGGMANAFDSRNATSAQAGTGGLLQGASYVTGLSGGGWLVSALTQANFPTLHDLVFGTDSDNAKGESSTYGGFLAQYGFIEATDNIIDEPEYLYDVAHEVVGKLDAGFPVTFTDVWARVLSRHFVNGTSTANFFDGDITHGAGLLWSDVANVPSLARLEQPFPIVIADSVSPNGNQGNDATDGFGVPLSNPIYEFNPYEFGSYDPSLSSFIPTRNLGSSGQKCVTGYDQTSYVQAITANVFNAAETDLVDKLVTALEVVIPDAGTGFLAAQIPNPFNGVSPSTFIDSAASVLNLGDGGEDGQEVPFQPLLVKARDVSVIVALDMATDGSSSFPAGGCLVDSAKRAALYPGTYSFPPVPSSTAEMQSLGLNSRPTFFGCDSAGDAPLVIYIPNFTPAGETTQTQTSTWQFTYESDQLQAMMNQAFDIATVGISSGNQKDPEWPTCLACAVVDRAREQAGIARSGTCESCMSRYCWKP